MKLMLRLRDGTLRRPEAKYLDHTNYNTGELVIEDNDAIHRLGIGVSAGIDLYPAVIFSYEATLFAREDRLLLRVFQSEDYGIESTRWRSSEDGGRTWQDVATAPSLDAWQRVDHVEA